MLHAHAMPSIWRRGDEMRTEIARVSLNQNRPASKSRQGRAFVIGLMLVVTAIIFAGFARTYYLNCFFARRSLTVALHLHGFLFSAWFVLLFVQIALIAKQRIDLHRRVGYGGALLALLMVIIGINVSIHAAKYGSPAIPPGMPIAKFLAVPLFEVVVFSCLAGAGLYYRFKPQVHRRLMILATLGILTAGLVRVPLDFIRNRDIKTIFLMGDAFALIYIAHDTLKYKRLHPACLFGGLLIILSVPLRFAIDDTQAWQNFTSWLVR
jgi:FtsH-binding integral membrane protein